MFIIYRLLAFLWMTFSTLIRGSQNRPLNLTLQPNYTRRAFLYLFLLHYLELIQVGPCLLIFRVKIEALIVIVLSCIQVFPHSVDVSKAVIGSGIGWLILYRQFQLLFSFFKFPLFQIAVTKSIVGNEVPLVQPYALNELFLCLFVVSLRLVNDSEAVVRSIELRITLDGFFEPVDGLGVVTLDCHMVGNIAEVVLGEMVVGVGLMVVGVGLMVAGVGLMVECLEEALAGVEVLLLLIVGGAHAEVAVKGWIRLQ